MDATSPLYGHSGLIADAELLVTGILQFFIRSMKTGAVGASGAMPDPTLPSADLSYA